MLFIIQVSFSILLCLFILPSTVMATPIEDGNLKLAINATTAAAKLKLITEHILPKMDDSTGTIPTSIPPFGKSTVTVDVLPSLYTAIAEHFHQRATKIGYKRFLEAVNEISFAKTEACNGSSRLLYYNESQLMQEFAYAYQSLMEDVHSVRSLYGKLLCHNSTQQGKVRRDALVNASACECPPGGLNSTETDWSMFSVCDFWACFEVDQVLRNILFPSDDNNHYPCLAFVIDTTASMGRQIDTAKRIILDFFRSEQEIGVDGCYILVPFNDVGQAYEIVPKESVGPVEFAYSTNSASELYEFYENVRNIRAGYIGDTFSSGGDYPEYALFAMRKALRAQDGPFPLMVHGSQMVVLTDAPSKQPELEDDVVRLAKQLNVCIHFFIEHNNELYHRIAVETHGTILVGSNHWIFTNFITAYQMGSCNFLDDSGRDKRSLPLQCRQFNVSRLAVNLRISINCPTGNVLTIICPNGTQTSITSGNNDLAFYTEINPAYGSWSIYSSDNEILDVKVITSDQTDVTVLYGSKIMSSILPNSCTSENIAIISSDHNLIQSVTLNIVDSNGVIIKHINLSKGNLGAFISDAVTFPSGSYFYQLTGIDIDGIAFKYDRRERITFTPPDIGAFSFIPFGELVVKMDLESSMTLEYNFINHWKYDTNFSFSESVPDGFSSSIEPEHALVIAGGAVKVQVLIRVIDQSIKPGTSHYLVNITASTCSDQQIEAPTKIITIKNPETQAPPVDECGGCLNGGSCVVYYRRGRRVARCSCKPGYIGRHCHVHY